MSGITLARADANARRFSPQRVVWILASLGVANLVLFVLGASLGSEAIDLRVAASDPQSIDGRILFGLRLPRLVLAAITGAALAAAGAAYQGLLRNPLADPFVLGVSGGAALGGTLTLVAGASVLPATVGGGAVAVGAALGAAAATSIAYVAGKQNGKLDPTRTLLVGVVFNSFAASWITVLKTTVSPEKSQELLFWLTGSIGYEPAGKLALTGAAIGVCVWLLSRQGHGLNLLALGEDGARSLGLDVRVLRSRIFWVASCAVGVAVSLTGLVAFVGLLVPHLLRLAFGPDYRLLVPASALGGAAFLLAADLGCRMLFVPLGTELPTGALTALAGGPFFLVLLRRRQVV